MQKSGVRKCIASSWAAKCFMLLNWVWVELKRKQQVYYSLVYRALTCFKQWLRHTESTGNGAWPSRREDAEKLQKGFCVVGKILVRVC